jgi:hypothetical protein
LTGAFYSVAERLGTVAVSRSEGPSTHYGSGVAAKQYDPGAPFFGAISYELLAISIEQVREAKTLLE